MSSAVRTRFAPSPTGYLHVGGARTALFNWLYARHHGGQFILRVEDTDAARNTEEARAAILDGMRWLGLDWDEGPEADGSHGPYYQSQRTEIYDRYLQQLLDADRAYEDEGTIRFRVPTEPVTIDDQICGSQSINLAEKGSTRWDAEKKEEVASNPDLVIRRADGSYIFHFVNVVDDIDMQISHVLRGEDHLTNTAKHIALFEAFGATPPVFAHIPLILNADGSKMSKRDAGAALGEYPKLGFLPHAVNNYLCLLGWSPKDDSEKMPMEEIIERFDIGGINRSNATFDLEKCSWLNGQHLADLSAEEFAQASLPYFGDEPPAAAAEVAALFHDKVRTLGEVPEAAAFMLGADFDPDPEIIEKLKGRNDAPTLLATLREKFDALTVWDEEQIGAAIEVTASHHEIKKGAVMFPCRAAASGRGGGPDLLPMLRLLGKERTLHHIDATLEKIAD